jgi:hypothetical protein
MPFCLGRVLSQLFPWVSNPLRSLQRPRALHLARIEPNFYFYFFYFFFCIPSRETESLGRLLFMEFFRFRFRVFEHYRQERTSSPPRVYSRWLLLELYKNIHIYRDIDKLPVLRFVLRRYKCVVVCAMPEF